MRIATRRKIGAGMASLLLTGAVGAAVVVGGGETAAADPRHVEKTPTKIVAKGGVDVRRGKAAPTRRVGERGKVPLTRTAGATGAVEGFADALAWSLTSEVAAQDPQFVPQALGGQLNEGDAAMLIGFDRSEGVDVDLASGAYRVLGYAGDKANPTQVMVEVVVPVEVGGVAQRLVAGGVVTRTEKGWIPTSMRPREMQRTPDLITKKDVVEDVEAGELGLGWETFAGPVRRHQRDGVERHPL